jgi:putative endonuclease
MAIHNAIGKKGETLAKSFLEEKGYEILETNWRYRRAEVDIIAMDGQVMVFVEVKTRSDDTLSQPEESITAQKELLMADAASAYMEKSGHDWEIRFDFISIVLQSDQHYNLEHFKDAFFN